MSPGDVFVIEPGTRHYFSSDNGLVLEEISSTHYEKILFILTRLSMIIKTEKLSSLTGE